MDSYKRACKNKCSLLLLLHIIVITVVIDSSINEVVPKDYLDTKHCSIGKCTTKI